jgi:Raf kinase inhibitor-like YbhB/YbcL family protein
MEKLIISSPVFTNNNFIPEKYSCDGDGINPPIFIEKVPERTESLALIMDDPDAASGTFVHWIIWNIDPALSQIAEDSVPGVEGLNSGGRKGYTGPCPPSSKHRYFFKVFALDSMVSLNANSKKGDLEKAMEGHVLAKGEIMGLYRR